MFNIFRNIFSKRVERSSLLGYMDGEALYDYYHAAVGRVVQHAVYTETIMCTTLEILTKLDTNVCSAIFYSLDALPSRKNMLQRVLVAINADDEITRPTDALVRAAEKCNAKRIELVHSRLIVLGGKKGGEAIQVRSKLQKQRWRSITPAYVQSVLAESQQAREECLKHYFVLLEALERQRSEPRA